MFMDMFLNVFAVAAVHTGNAALLVTLLYRPPHAAS